MFFLYLERVDPLRRPLNQFIPLNPGNHHFTTERVQVFLRRI